jgi:hypothetical protein
MVKVCKNSSHNATTKKPIEIQKIQESNNSEEVVGAV